MKNYLKLLYCLSGHSKYCDIFYWSSQYITSCISSKSHTAHTPFVIAVCFSLEAKRNKIFKNYLSLDKCQVHQL